MGKRLIGQNIDFCKHLMTKMVEYEPCTDHIYPSSLTEIEKALASQEFTRARVFLDMGRQEGTYSGYCLSLFKEYVNFLAFGKEPCVEFKTAFSCPRLGD